MTILLHTLYTSIFLFKTLQCCLRIILRYKLLTAVDVVYCFETFLKTNEIPKKSEVN